MSPASPSSSAGAAPDQQAAGADCECLASCKDWPRMRERLLQRMTDSAAQEASQSAQEPGPPGTPTCAEAPSKQWLSGGTAPSVGSCSGVSVEQSPSTRQPKDRAGQKEAWNAAGRLPVRWRQVAPAGVLLLMLLLAFSGPAWRGGMSITTQSRCSFSIASCFLTPALLSYLVLRLATVRSPGDGSNRTWMSGWATHIVSECRSCD